MSFIVAAASTAAVSAISAGAITGGVTGAIAAGSIGATLGGVAAGAATAGALGAGIGAIGAAATGGDVGKGALSGAISGAVTGGIAPGLGGATAGLGTVGSGIVTGGIAGAAGSAAGAAAVGEDAGKAALMGGGIGAVGGAIGGATKGNVTMDKGAMAGVDGASTGVEGDVFDDIASGAQGNYAKSPFADGVATMELPHSPTTAMSPTANASTPFLAPATPIAPSSEGLGTRLASAAGDVATNYGQQIVNNPTAIAKSALPDLATGAYYGGGLDTQHPTEQPTVTQDIGGAPLADTYQRTGDAERKTLPKYYAAGGGIPRAAEAKPLLNESITPAQPQTMNKFAGMGFEAAKIGDQAYQTQQQTQQQQPQPQPQPQQPQVGIPRPMPPTPPPTQLQTPTQQSQPMFYAAGGAVQGDVRDTFTQQVRALAAQKVKEHYAQQARDLLAQQQAQQQQQYSQPRSQVISTTNDGAGNSVSNTQPFYAQGGLTESTLGGYSHGGISRLTRGPGDGVSDSIPAEIGSTGKQPARLADGEFVVPARIVSELGNGSTEAGAKALQAMVDRVQKRRSKTIGKGKVAVNSRARKELA